MKPLARSLATAATALAAGTALAVAIGSYAAPGAEAVAQQCAAQAWRVANRNHSILESAVFRRTERQAYRSCLRDPAAFDRLIRQGS